MNADEELIKLLGRRGRACYLASIDTVEEVVEANRRGTDHGYTLVDIVECYATVLAVTRHLIVLDRRELLHPLRPRTYQWCCDQLMALIAFRETAA